MVKFRFDSVCDQEFVKSAGLVGSRVKPVDGEKVLLSPKGIPFRTPAFKEIGQLFIIGLLVYDKDLYEWENLPKPFAKKYNSFVKDVNIFRKEQESYTGEKLKSRMHSLYSQWCELCRFAEKKYGIETAPYSGIGINGKILSTISSSVGLL